MDEMFSPSKSNIKSFSSVSVHVFIRVQTLSMYPYVGAMWVTGLYRYIQ